MSVIGKLKILTPRIIGPVVSVLIDPFWLIAEVDTKLFVGVSCFSSTSAMGRVEPDGALES